MRLLSVSSLKPCLRLARSLYHPGGEVLLPAGQPLSDTNLMLLKAAGIREVVEVEPGDDLKRFQFEASFDPVPIESVPADQPLERGIYDPNGMLLLKAGKALSGTRRDQLEWRGLTTLYMPRRDRDEDRVHAYREAIEICQEMEEAYTPPAEHLVAGPADLSPDRLDEWHEARRVRRRRAEPLEGWPIGKERPAPRTVAYVRTYTATMGGVEQLFSGLSEGKGAEGRRIASISGRVIRSVLKDPQLAANLLNFRGDAEYLIAHSTRVAYVAVAIGTGLGYKEDELTELAYGAFLMDIGMTKVPQTILLKRGALTADERSEVERHPLLGLDLLQRIDALPKSAALVAYQSHERLDGSGYPRGRTGALIHEHAKIVAIADTFDALSSERPYRPALLPYKAMEEVILQAGRRKVSSEIVRAFLDAVSLFPIGSWVELSDGRIGRVVSAHRANYHRPVLRLWKEGTGMTEWIDLRLRPEVSVVRAVPAPPGCGSLLAGF